LFDKLIRPTVVIGRPFFPRKLHIVKLLCIHFFFEDLDNDKFVKYIRKKFYDSFIDGDIQVMNFLCTIFDKKYPPHQWYSLNYPKHMSTKCFAASEIRYILPNNHAAFMFLLEMGMSQFGTMTPEDFRNIYSVYEHRPSIFLNDILRLHILNSLLIQRYMEFKFSSDLSSNFLTYAGIPWGASLDSLQSVLNFYKINYFA
jgi:hypothetical protein